MALWGESFAAPKPAGRELAVPLEADPFPQQAEPLGGLLALLFEEDVRAVAVQGGLVGYLSVLESPFCYVPHDALVPAANTAGDLGDLAAALAPRPLRLEALVDGLNRKVPADPVTRTFEPARAAYRSVGVAERLRLDGEKAAVASWLLKQLRAD